MADSVNERNRDFSPIVEQVTLFAVALRLGRLTIFAGIVDVDVILNCAFSGLREVDLQVGAIAPFITLNHSETNNQIVRGVGLEFGEISALRQRLYQKVAVLVSSRTLQERSATLPVLVGHEQREWLLSQALSFEFHLPSEIRKGLKPFRSVCLSFILPRHHGVGLIRLRIHRSCGNEEYHK